MVFPLSYRSKGWVIHWLTRKPTEHVVKCVERVECGVQFADINVAINAAKEEAQAALWVRCVRQARAAVVDCADFCWSQNAVVVCHVLQISKKGNRTARKTANQ